jgi:hypothetical protein
MTPCHCEGEARGNLLSLDPLRHCEVPLLRPVLSVVEGSEGLGEL